MGSSKTAKTELFAQWVSGNMVVADQSLSTGRRIFLDATTGSDAGGYGASPEKPVATLDYAFGLCTDSQGDIIYAMPGHAETEASAVGLAEMDIDGVTLQGLGHGADRPTFNFTHADADMTVTGASLTIRNCLFVSGVANCKTTLNVGADADGLTLEDCEFKDGGTSGTELLNGITLATTITDVLIRNCRFLTVEGGTIASAILFAGSNGNCRIQHCYFNGAYATAAILGSAGTGTQIQIFDNWMKVTDGEPGIELKSDTTGVISRNHIESTGVTADAAIVAADCSWFENYCVIGDGLAAELVGVSTESFGPDASQSTIMGQKVIKTAADVLTGGIVNLFTVAGGMVAIHGLVGITSGATGSGGASNCNYNANPTTGSANDLCTTVDRPVSITVTSDTGGVRNSPNRGRLLVT